MKIISIYENNLTELIDSLMERVPSGDADELHSALIALARIVKAQQAEIEKLKEQVKRIDTPKGK